MMFSYSKMMDNIKKNTQKINRFDEKIILNKQGDILPLANIFAKIKSLKLLFLLTQYDKKQQYL